MTVAVDWDVKTKFNKLKKRDSRHMRFPTMWYVRLAKPQISLRTTSDQPVYMRSLIRAFARRFKYGFLSLKGGGTGSSVKMQHFFKSHVATKLFSFDDTFYLIDTCSCRSDVNLAYSVGFCLIV